MVVEQVVQIVSSGTPITQGDRAYNYGDGIFTTICVNNHIAELLPWHLSRLVHDASALAINVNAKELHTAIQHHLIEKRKSAQSAQNNAAKYVLKVHISAGEAGRGYARDEAKPALVRFSEHDYPAHYDNTRATGLDVICASIALAVQPALAGIKHMNRLEQVLIKREVNLAEADDAIVCDTNDNIVEASAGNLFFHSNGVWFTPSLKGSGVNGVVRQCLIQSLLNENVPLNVGEYGLEQLQNADTAVVTNALMGIMPIRSVAFPDGVTKHYSVSNTEVTYLKSVLEAQRYVSVDLASDMLSDIALNTSQQGLV